MNLPVTIRNKNPGAMWPGYASRKFGSAAFEKLKDGQANQAATFATSVQGGAAMMYLLATSKYYKGQTIATAIDTWSGSNSTNSYLAQIESLTDFSRGDFLEPALFEDCDQFTSLCKAMAHHETGFDYPMSDDDWRAAHEMFMSAMAGQKPAGPVAKSAPMTAALEHALSHLGEREIAGSEDNPFIVSCFEEVGRPEIKDDETAWCAAFAGATLKASGYAYLHGRLDARSYLNYGEEISEPEVGAICVMWRVAPDSWQGHVAFVESFTTDEVVLVGGNQNDSVSRMTVSRGEGGRILGYRRPIGAKAPLGEVMSSRSMQLKSTGVIAGVGLFFWQIADAAKDVIVAVWNAAAGVWTEAPAIAVGVTSQVNAGKSLFHALSLPWPVYVAATIGATALAINVYETYQRKRNRQDADTSPEGRIG